MGDGFLGLVGTWGVHSLACTIINVYSPCGLEEKCRLWMELVTWCRESTMTIWCIGGDFNVVCHVEERRGVAVTFQGGTEMAEFNLFIDHMEVMEIPLGD